MLLLHGADDVSIPVSNATAFANALQVSFFLIFVLECHTFGTCSAPRPERSHPAKRSGHTIGL